MTTRSPTRPSSYPYRTAISKRVTCTALAVCFAAVGGAVACTQSDDGSPAEAGAQGGWTGAGTPTAGSGGTGGASSSGATNAGGMAGAGACSDDDGDGYTSCDNDCDDSDPLVNPGAFDFVNSLDDDCDQAADNPTDGCGSGLAYGAQAPWAFAQAIDICQTTAENASGAAKTWGLIAAQLVLADGSGQPFFQSHAIVEGFGSAIGPRRDVNFALLSTGYAATPAQPYYQGSTPQIGTVTGTSCATPQGFPSNKAGCPTPAGLAFDSVNLKLRLRTPTNAHSLAVDWAFWSAEYPEHICSPLNDLFLVLLDSAASGVPNNKNIAFDAAGTPPCANVGFFDRCMSGATGCFGSTPGFNWCGGGTDELAGTGYGSDDPDEPCGQPTTVGGGTGWLTTESPIVPGETIEVQLVLWDSTDGTYDSAALIDAFRWQEASLSGPVTYRP